MEKQLGGSSAEKPLERTSVTMGTREAGKAVSEFVNTANEFPMDSIPTPCLCHEIHAARHTHSTQGSRRSHWTEELFQTNTEPGPPATSTHSWCVPPSPGVHPGPPYEEASSRQPRAMEVTDCCHKTEEKLSSSP